MDYDKWISAGERLGLAGTELQTYVEKKEKEFLEREARQQRRDDERLEKEALFKREEQEREIMLLKLRLEAGAVKAPEPSSKSLRPKLPKFEEKTDDMDAYIERFERFACSQHWPEDTWAVSLSSLLTGKGLEVYTSMPADRANDYKELKKAVLKRYQLTEEGFRQKFRDSKPEQGETVFQFMSRLVRYFTRWTEMAEVDETFESLMDLLVREQFIQTCSSELALFLKERMPKSRDEVTQLAEQYIEAHGGSITSKRTPTKPSSNPPRASPGLATKPQMFQRNANTRQCFICRREGHIARDCRQNKQNEHKKVSAMCMSVDVNRSKIQECIKDGELQLANGQSVPVIASGCTIDSLEGERNLNLQDGFVGSKPVRVLRDTGCELAAVRKDLISDYQMLDKRYVMITIDGRAKIVPAAHIQVETPYYSGGIEVMVLETLICDLVLGNVKGVSDTPARQWLKEGASEQQAEKVAAAVVTRAQAKKDQRPLKALKVPSSKFDELNIDGLQKAQQDDASLRKLWSFAEESCEMKTKGGNKYRYVVQ